MKRFVFHLGLGFLFTHELDAMPNHEWRVLPLLRSLPDDGGMTAFTLAHVPLFAVVTALVASPSARVRRAARLLIAGFLVVHAALHAWFVGHPAYDFGGRTSTLLIAGGAACGAITLVLEGRARRPDPV